MPAIRTYGHLALEPEDNELDEAGTLEVPSCAGKGLVGGVPDGGSEPAFFLKGLLDSEEEP